jgi:hypothetical protein
MNNGILILLLILCKTSILISYEVDSNRIISPINNKYITSLTDSYSILIAGHLYGAPENNKSVFPSSSILGVLNEINKNNYSFFVSFGDCVRSPQHVYINNF